MTKTMAKKEAAKITIRETRLVKNNTVFMTRLTNGVVGYGDNEEEATHEAYERAARAIMRAVNTGRISHLSAEQIRNLDRALK